MGGSLVMFIGIGMSVEPDDWLRRWRSVPATAQHQLAWPYWVVGRDRAAAFFTDVASKDRNPVATAVMAGFDKSKGTLTMTHVITDRQWKEPVVVFGGGFCRMKLLDKWVLLTAAAAVPEFWTAAAIAADVVLSL